uniref:Cysteine-rich protein n=1 Tax=Spironucleus salmonicida TaxID=348837 RepID=V6LXR1_9EUKA|eukprot:EST49038.1 hypothetical protein SS50377_10697 [Spironucleus salmonicida]
MQVLNSDTILIWPAVFRFQESGSRCRYSAEALRIWRVYKITLTEPVRAGTTVRVSILISCARITAPIPNHLPRRKLPRHNIRLYCGFESRTNYKMGNSSTCTSTANYCYAGQFCPATSGTEVFCKFCSTGVTPGQGCSCKRYHEIKGCSKCDGDDCVECLPGHFLQENTCQQCAKGCELCDSIYGLYKVPRNSTYSTPSAQIASPPALPTMTARFPRVISAINFPADARHAMNFAWYVYLPMSAYPAYRKKIF